MAAVMVIGGHHAGNDAQCTHKNSSAVSVLCSTLGLCCRISPLLSGCGRRRAWSWASSVSHSPFAPCICWNVVISSLLWPCICRRYQPLREGTVSHEDPHTAAQHLMHLGVGEVLWLCWLPSDLAERPHFVTSKGFSLPKMGKSHVGSDAH